MLKLIGIVSGPMPVTSLGGKVTSIRQRRWTLGDCGNLLISYSHQKPRRRNIKVVPLRPTSNSFTVWRWSLVSLGVRTDAWSVPCAIVFYVELSTKDDFCAVIWLIQVNSAHTGLRPHRLPFKLYKWESRRSRCNTWYEVMSPWSITRWCGKIIWGIRNMEHN